MSDPQLQTANQYADESRALLQELQKQAKQVKDEHPELGSSEGLPAGTEAYSCSAEVTFIGAF